MDNKVNITCRIFILFFCVFYSNASLADSNDAKNILSRLEKAQKSDWKERQKEIIDINKSRRKGLKLNDIEKKKIIDMFDDESNFQEQYIKKMQNKGLSYDRALDDFAANYRKKGYVKYYGEFAGLVSSQKDVRATPSLLKGLHYYGGAIVPSHITNLGEGAVEPLLNLAKSKDRATKVTAYSVLAKWVNAPIKREDYSITEEMSIRDKSLLNRIKSLFLKSLHDKDMDIRSASVYGLGAFPESIVLEKLEEVAKKDPLYSKYSKTFLIREDAEIVIKKIKEKMKKIKEANSIKKNK